MKDNNRDNFLLKNKTKLIRKAILMLFICFNFIFSYAQSTEITEATINARFKSVEKNIGQNNNETIKHALKIYKDSESINYKGGILKSGRMLMIYYFNMGDIKKSIEYGNKIEKIAKEQKNKVKLGEIYNYRAMCLSTLGLLDECYKEFQNAITVTKSYENKNNEMHYDLSKIYNNMVSSYYQIIKAPQDTILLYLKKSLNEVEQIDNTNEGIKVEWKYETIAFNKMNIGMFYAGVHKPQRLDLAEQYLTESLAIIQKHRSDEPKDRNNELTLLTSLGRISLERKEYNEAISYAQKALWLERKIKSTHSRQLAYSILTDAYKEKGNKDSINKYLTNYSNLTDSLNQIKTLNSHEELKKINSKQTASYNNNLKSILLCALILILLLLVLVTIYWKKQNRKLYAKYQNILETLRREEKDNSVEKSIPLHNNKLTDIADETTKALLIKLEDFEKSQTYLQQEVSLIYLANQFKTNTRYLSQIIKMHREKNFSNYINELRIKFIMEKLYKDPLFREYKISYLAEYCGYSSREVFFNAFKKETGIPPSYFINQLKEIKADQN